MPVQVGGVGAFVATGAFVTKLSISAASATLAHPRNTAADKASPFIPHALSRRPVAPTLSAIMIGSSHRLKILFSDWPIA
jgi:hypothetical protein